MTRIRISALKVLVLAGFCALVSLVPSARAAGPFATPECSMPGGGCPTGLGIGMLTTMDVSYCEHDPGHNPDFLEDYYWPTTINPCGPGFVLNVTCVEGADQVWVDELTEIDKTYRKDVCACWAQFPDDPAKRDDCIFQADLRYVQERKLLRTAWALTAGSCCEAVP